MKRDCRVSKSRVSESAFGTAAHFRRVGESCARPSSTPRDHRPPTDLAKRMTLLTSMAAAMAFVASPIVLRPVSPAGIDSPVMSIDDDSNPTAGRRAICSLAAAGIVFGAGSAQPAFAGKREDGIALLRKRAADAKKAREKAAKKPPPEAGSVWKPKKRDQRPEGFKKCNVEKPCATGASLFKWEPEAYGFPKKATENKNFPGMQERQFDYSKKPANFQPKSMPVTAKPANPYLAPAPAPAPTPEPAAADSTSAPAP